MTKMNANEADALLKGARRLDRVVLTQVFDVFYPQLYVYIVFRIGDPKLSAQICGQVFTNLLESLSKLGEPTRNLAGWLYQSAGSLVDAYLQNIIFESPRGDSGSEALMEDEMSSSIVQSPTGYRLQAVFQRLVPEHQHLLALRFCGQNSLEEISRILEKSSRAVKDQQFQALKSLQQALQARVR